MSAMILVIVMMAVSAQINSLSAIFMYDIYQTYISPLRLARFTETDGLAVYSDSQLSQYVTYNRQSVFVRHAVTVFFSILTFPAAIAYLSVELEFYYKVLFVALITSSTVLPVCLSISWWRTSGWGFCAGVWLGLVSGVGAWIGVAARFDGGLGDFVTNTGRLEAVAAGLASSYVASGFFCVLITIFTGGLDDDRSAEEEWEKCGSVDNPARPWVLQYAVAAYSRYSIEYVGVPGYEEVVMLLTFLYSIISSSSIPSSWWRGTVVERRSLTGELSLSCARPAADG